MNSSDNSVVTNATTNNVATSSTIQATDIMIKVLTVNLHKGFSALNRKFVLPELRSALRDVGADIVFLQEVIGEHALHSDRQQHWPDSPQYEYLADTMWNDFAYGRNAVYPEGHHGNALLSKFPILSNRNLDATFSRSEKRGLLHCCLTVPGTDLQIHTVCVHLGLREKHRQQQVDLLCNLIDELPLDAPVIVAGDFNDWRLQADEKLKKCTGLEEVFVSAYGMPATTFPSRWPILRLDRIYVRNARIHSPINLTVRPWSHLSDHAPLAAAITLSCGKKIVDREISASDVKFETTSNSEFDRE
ncbi:MAG: Endonuclease/exonuclease/phosphatase [Verrucomicrobiaceae bacterium]|nr:Endonuclease/exonuclease/phosphatase [Verrucomicrobiaceae bacterium]